MRGDPLARFLAQLNTAGRCWTWTGSTRSHGYGRFWDGTRKVLAHRAAYEWTFGAIEPGTVVMHTCDNPACCNPAHLVNGTQADNMADKVRKRRQSRARPWNADNTHCVHGHEYTPENTGRQHRGWRYCRTCTRSQARAYQARLRATKTAAATERAF